MVIGGSSEGNRVREICDPLVAPRRQSLNRGGSLASFLSVERVRRAAARVLSVVPKQKGALVQPELRPVAMSFTCAHRSVSRGLAPQEPTGTSCFACHKVECVESG